MSSSATDSTVLRIGTLIELPASAMSSLERSALGPFELHLFEDLEQALARSAQGDLQALILSGDTGPVLAESDTQDAAARAAAELAVLIVCTQMDPARLLNWLRRGVQDVLLSDELLGASLDVRLRAAIERKRLERDARTAYATDLGTGLPHQQQLIEHMSQLLALREREPAPMAVLALRIEGLATTQARLGREASNALRRKLGVRLRLGVRASDVVASLGDDSYAVLLGSILTPADANRVGAKLLASLLEPFHIAGHDVAVATAIGIGQYPQDGSQPDVLLRRAVGLANAAQAQGRAGFANYGEVNASTQGAANDE
jgi:GGDEF domain-containing protein